MISALIFCVLGAVLGGSAHAQLVLPGNQWLAGPVEDGRVGEALTFCDFDADGFDDLAIGMPSRSLGNIANAGKVEVHGGSVDGIAGDSSPRKSFFESSAGGTVGPGHRFGAAVAAADFDLDGACDLAIGAPGAPVGGLNRAGRVVVIYGSFGSGLDLGSAVYFDQGDLTSPPEIGDNFGAVLAAGALGNEPHPDLVIGVVGEDIASLEDAGAINILFSDDENGLGTAQAAYLHQDTDGVFGFSSPGDRFGSSLAIGDLNADGENDLIVGSPGDLVGVVDDAGSAQLFPGDGSGVEIDNRQIFWHQDTQDVLGNAAEGDNFGHALALGDFDGNDHLDVAIGVPGESQFGPGQSGAVQVFYGSEIGVSATNNQILFESLISPETAMFDRFATTLAAGDFDADQRDDLAIGYPLDNIFGVVNTGNVAVLYGTPSGLQITGAQLWNGLFLLTLEPGDELGAALAVGRSAGAGTGLNLAIGVPGRENEEGEVRAGGVLLLQSLIPLFADGFESGNIGAWQIAQ